MTRRRTALACLLALPLSLALGRGPATAQISPFGRGPNTQRMTAEDRRLLWENTAALNESPSPRRGESRSWHNAGSGNAGMVTLTRIFRSNGMPCHALHYSITIAVQQAPQTYDLTWCRVATGEWKILD